MMLKSLVIKVLASLVDFNDSLIPLLVIMCNYRDRNYQVANYVVSKYKDTI